MSFASIQPTAGALTDLYTVPVGKSMTLRVIITNTGGDTTVRLSVANGGAADALTQYLMRDEALLANKSISTAPMRLEAGDVVRASSVSGAVNFHVTGIQT